MVTTLTATPQPDTATILLNVSGDPADYPVEVLARSAGELYAEATTLWSGFDTVNLFGDLVAFYSVSAGSTITRTITGLTIGETYRVQVSAQRTAQSTQYGVTGKVTGTIPAGSGVWVHSVEFIASATSHVVFIYTYQNNLPYLSRLVVTELPAVYDLASFTLTRTDANGIRPVRLLDGQEIVDGSMIVQDAEAAMTGLVTYQLTSASGQTSSTTTTLESAGFRLAPAQFPQFATTLDMVTGYDAARTSQTIVHEVIGRADPVARIGVFLSRRGTLTLWCSSYEALTAVAAVYRRGEVVMFRQPAYAGLDMYHVAMEMGESTYDDAGRRWKLTVRFAEVAYPRGPLLGAAGWTYADVLAMFPTYADVAAFFATYAAVQVGP